MNQHILYIEDENELRETTVYFLQREGFEVDVGIDYQDAANLITARNGKPYDLALLDFNFNDKNDGNLGGYHVAELVHNTWEGQVPCIVLSAQARNLSSEHTRYFAEKYEKPISRSALIEAVMSGIIASTKSETQPVRPADTSKTTAQPTALDKVA